MTQTPPFGCFAQLLWKKVPSHVALKALTEAVSRDESHFVRINALKALDKHPSKKTVVAAIESP